MINFKLRSLVLDEDRAGCRFDVTPAQFVLLGGGTKELVGDFLLNMKVEAEPSEWTITPFYTHYYSQDPDANQFRDLFPLAFRVRARFAQRFDGPAPRDPFAQYVSSASDPTWDPERRPLERTHSRLVIVADNFHATSEALLSGLEQRSVLKAACQEVEMVQLAQNILQMRMDVGELEFPADEQRAYTLMEEASYFCRSFTWTLSVKLA